MLALPVAAKHDSLAWPWRLVIALLPPPVAAYLQVGTHPQFWINLVLTLVGWPLGFLHALWLVLAMQFRPATADRPT